MLTQEEEFVDRQTAELRFNIGLLAARLVGVTKWVTQQASTRSLPIGYFGASTGAAAALVAAAQLPDLVGVVVSRGGRPDFAAEALGKVRASVLLLVGGLDEKVISLNRQALSRLQCQNKRLVVVPGATHLFEEPGKLEQVAQAAAAWFTQHLAPDQGSKEFLSECPAAADDDSQTDLPKSRLLGPRRWAPLGGLTMLDATLPIISDLVREAAHPLTGSQTDYDHFLEYPERACFDLRTADGAGAPSSNCRPWGSFRRRRLEPTPGKPIAEE